MATKQKSAAASFLDSIRADIGFQPELVSITTGPTFYDTLRDKLQKVTIEGEDLYIAEGDTLLDEAQLEVYAMQKEASNKAIKSDAFSDSAGLGRSRLTDDRSRGLVGITQQGKIVRWQPGLVLTYCILKRTFSNAANYDLVSKHFEKATQEWEETCGIKFKHQSSLDDSTNTDPQDLGVIFVVREFNAAGQFIAAAFFPNDPNYRRRVLIDPSYYQPGGFDKVGVLRHELGHVLGFRHEHIRSNAPDGCPDETLTNTTNLTEYDSKSVMHYLCGGLGDPALKISATDKAGAQKVYGLPFSAAFFVS
jgi:hypothetical protein